MSKVQKITAAFITATVILSISACGHSQADSDAPAKETGPDMEQAIKDADDYCAEQPLCFSDNESVPVKDPTREYFEELDKESSLEDIVTDIGPYGIQGSGIIYHVWKLNDGTAAYVVFDSKDKLTMIYIIGDNHSERIYKREY